jgi:hypothetical protein
MDYATMDTKMKNIYFLYFSYKGRLLFVRSSLASHK